MNFSEFLDTVPSFAEFTQQELAVLEQALVVSEFPDGHVFFREGEAADSMYLVVAGEVVATRRRPEMRRPIVLDRLNAGELFGLVSLIDHRPHIMTCTAVGETTVATLPRIAFELLYKANANVGYHFQKLIARQLVHDLRVYSQALRESITNSTSEASDQS